MRPVHLLFIRFSSLGDVILASSVPRALKERWGERVHISFLTSAGFAPLLSGVPWIDSLHTISRKKGVAGLLEVLATVKKIRQERPLDFMVDMHGTLRSLCLRLANADVPRVFVDKRSLERWILTGLKIDLLSQQGPASRPPGFGEILLERNVRDFAGLFDLTLPSFPLSSCAPTFKRTQVDWSKWGIEDPGAYLTFAPSASFPEKRWPASQFYLLLEKLCQEASFRPFQFIILAGPEDEFCRLFDPLQKRFPGRIHNLQGKTNLLESTQILQHSLFCVGNDTGLPHMAESVGVPVVAILGPTGEEFGYYPHLPQSEVVMKKLWCRPCTTNGKGNCIRSERFCLTTITVDEVFQAITQLYGKLR